MEAVLHHNRRAPSSDEDVPFLVTQLGDKLGALCEQLLQQNQALLFKQEQLEGQLKSLGNKVEQLGKDTRDKDEVIRMMADRTQVIYKMIQYNMPETHANGVRIPREW